MRKNSSTKPPGSGILVNKSSSDTNKSIAVNNVPIEPLNHFDKIQPKDDLEIKKHRDESTSSAHAHSNKKEGKKSKQHGIRYIYERDTISFHFQSGGTKHAKKDSSPASQPEKLFNEVVDNHLIVPVETVAVAVVAKESPKNAPTKEKNSKKKKSDAALISQLSKYSAQFN